MGRGKSKIVHRMSNYKRAVIARAKLKNYLLNPSKSNGKAAFFKSLGYNMQNFRRLEKDIRKGIAETDAVMYIENRYGHNVKVYNINLSLGIDRKAVVLTSWQVDDGSTIPRFITAFPPNKKKE